MERWDNKVAREKLKNPHHQKNENERRSTTMKKITNNIERIRETNGGGYYSCRVCGYSNKSYWNVYKHAVGHTAKAAWNMAGIVSFFL